MTGEDDAEFVQTNDHVINIVSGNSTGPIFQIGRIGNGVVIREDTAPEEGD